jgi:hypothetical protein
LFFLGLLMGIPGDRGFCWKHSDGVGHRLGDALIASDGTDRRLTPCSGRIGSTGFARRSAPLGSLGCVTVEPRRERQTPDRLPPARPLHGGSLHAVRARILMALHRLIGTYGERRSVQTYGVPFSRRGRDPGAHPGNSVGRIYRRWSGRRMMPAGVLTGSQSINFSNTTPGRA